MEENNNLPKSKYDPSGRPIKIGFFSKHKPFIIYMSLLSLGLIWILYTKRKDGIFFYLFLILFIVAIIHMIINYKIGGMDKALGIDRSQPRQSTKEGWIQFWIFFFVIFSFCLGMIIYILSVQ